jgi:molybdopterin synthase catalytic subunit
MILLVDEPIDTTAILERVRSPQAGAVVLFLGTVREVTHGRETASLDYECYPEMAQRKLAELEETARRRWPLVECALVHRLGHMELGETSVAVAVSSAHRQAAFEAGQWLIDTLKQVVPIWKKENWADGTSEWVRPGETNGTPTADVPLASETQTSRARAERGGQPA